MMMFSTTSNIDHPVFYKDSAFFAETGEGFRCLEEGFPGKWEFIGSSAPGWSVLRDFVCNLISTESLPTFEPYVRLGEWCFSTDGHWWVCVKPGWPGEWKRVEKSRRDEYLIKHMYAKRAEEAARERGE